jgi:apolipoprotein N-acyltransferase
MQSTLNRKPATQLMAAAPKTAASSVESWICVACAAALLLIADGRDTAALAIWPAEALLLRFVRTQPMLRGLGIVYVLRVATLPIAERGMIPIPVPYFYIFLVIAGLSGLIPFVIDRWIAPRLSGFAGTLVFPTALVVQQYIYGKGPVGSWGSIAYSQSGNLGLEQLLSVTGLSGIVFLIGWFASSMNWAWEGPTPRRFAAFATVLALVVLGGELRLALAPPSAPTVRIASLSRNDSIAHQVDEFTDKVAHQRASAEEVTAFRAENAAMNTDLMARSEREAKAGAKIIFWAEGNAQLLKQDEPELLSKGSVLARRYDTYLGMALSVWTPGAPKPLENKVVLIAPNGQVAWQYWKVRPTPGPEMAASVPTDGRLRFLNTPYGRLTTSICYDMDFPSLLSQAGKSRVDLALSPASDWHAIDPRHTEIASFRAIEQGFNLVRQSSGGLSAAYDYEGHVLAAADSYHGGDGTLIAEVPTRGVRTIYALLGDWFVLVAGIVLASVAVKGLRRNSRQVQ